MSNVIEMVIDGDAPIVPSGLRWFGQTPANWSVARIKDAVTIANGDWGEDAPDNHPDAIICLRKADFGAAGVVTKGETKRLLKRRPFVRSGDVLLEKSGGGDLVPVGAAAFVDLEEPAACSNFLARLRARGEFDSKFVWYFLSAQHASPYAWTLFTQSTGIQNVDMSRLRGSIIFKPPLEEQLAIVRYLDAKTASIDKERALLERRKALLQEQKKAAIHEAVTRGLNRNAPMKASGVDWIGEIPRHWVLRRAKDVLAYRKKLNVDRSEQVILSLTLRGVRRHEKLTP